MFERQLVPGDVLGSANTAGAENTGWEGGLGNEGLGGTEFSFWADENALVCNSGDDYTTLRMR